MLKIFTVFEFLLQHKFLNKSIKLTEHLASGHHQHHQSRKSATVTHVFETKLPNAFLVVTAPRPGNNTLIGRLIKSYTQCESFR